MQQSLFCFPLIPNYMNCYQCNILIGCKEMLCNETLHSTNQQSNQTMYTEPMPTKTFEMGWLALMMQQCCMQKRRHGILNMSTDTKFEHGIPRLLS